MYLLTKIVEKDFISAIWIFVFNFFLKIKNSFKIENIQVFRLSIFGDSLATI